MLTILGLSASLRNARVGRGSEGLCDEIRSCGTADELCAYLARQTKVRAAEMLEASANGALPFRETYENLRRAPRAQGLSNSEGALAAALWGAHQAGAQIRHCGLVSYFPASGARRRLGELRAEILAADGFVLSGPVYFGDRGSLAQEFIEFLREDEVCAAHVRDRVFGGVAVGAKRNGGQETTLIYQMVDLTNLNMLAVGNDTETTSQYGGTAVAGDVGTLDKDRYGIDTAIGTGRRVARASQLLRRDAAPLARPARVAVWLLQDNAAHRGRALIERLTAESTRDEPRVEWVIQDFTEEAIYRCLACDICPVEPGPAEEYRCTVTAEQDLFRRHHTELLGADAIVLAAYSPVDRHDVRSVYQRFMERTRYLRRDDYLFSNVLTAPLVISEVNSNQNLHIRMLTSFVRHHTILHHPLLGVEYEGTLLNWEYLRAQAGSFARNAVRVARGRETADRDSTSYNPIGYVISAHKTMLDRAAATAADGVAR